MLTYDQLAPILYTVGKKLSVKSGGKYEVAELVNECWIIGYIQKLSDVRLAYQRARLDMMCYMRKQDGKRRTKKITYHPLEPNLLIEYNVPEIDLEDEMDSLIRRLTKRQRLICKLLMDGYNQREIAEILGYSAPWVSQLVARIRSQYQVRIQSISLTH